MHINTQPFLFSYSFFLLAGFDEVSVESYIDIYIVTVNSILSLPLVQADPHLIIQLQLQHQALALHDGAVAGLGIHNRPLCVILHYVEVCLLEVPRVNVDVEEVDPWDVADKYPLEHVEVAVEVHEDCVKYKRLIGIHAVKGFSTADGESGVLDFTGVSWETSLTLRAFGSRGPPRAWRSFESSFAWRSSVTTVSFVT